MTLLHHTFSHTFCHTCMVPPQERRMAKDYVDALDEPVHSGIKQAWILGATYGSFQVPGGLSGVAG